VKIIDQNVIHVGDKNCVLKEKLNPNIVENFCSAICGDISRIRVNPNTVTFSGLKIF
jgi:hypothetical protein